MVVIPSIYSVGVSHTLLQMQMFHFSLLPLTGAENESRKLNHIGSVIYGLELPARTLTFNLQSVATVGAD